MKLASLSEVVMRGIIHVEVSNRDAKFRFDLFRNITIVRGDSGTGKTTLYEMVADHTRLKDRSGVNVSCSKACVALTDTDWQNQLGNIGDSIVFIDEDFAEADTRDFAQAIKNSDNYYVIFNREALHQLPYSVEEIYKIKTSGKYHKFVKMFRSDDKHFYRKGKSRKNFNPEIFMTEDSGSGFQFYEEYFKDAEVKCETTGGNSEIYKFLRENRGKKIFVIADGAAFGSEIDRVLKLDPSYEFALCLPESFEWLILRSGLVGGAEVRAILENPSDHIESAENFSWEIFFEKYLTQITQDTVFVYKKSKINGNYLIRKNAETVVEEIFTEQLPFIDQNGQGR